MLIAIHEAGHVVVAHLLGKRVTRVKLGGTRDLGTMACQWDDEWSGEKLAAEVSIASAGEIAEITWHLLAGRWAEAEAVKYDGSNASDRLKAEVAATKAAELLSLEREAVYSSGVQNAIQLLKENWDLTLAVANSLAEAGELVESDLATLLSRTQGTDGGGGE